MTEVDPSGTEPPRARVRYVQIGLAALAVLVPLRLLALILRSSVFSAFDYFEMVPTVLDADGSVVWSGLLVHQNDHLMVIPKIAYLVNIWVFAGSNVSLGVFVWLVAGGVAGVLGLALRHHLPTDGWNLPLVAWLFAVYLFPLQAQHNFRLAMSGTAWITANLLAIAAIVLAVRARPIPAAGFAALATLTYGTGLAVWPALGVVMLLRRRFGRGEAVVVTVGLASVLLQRLTAGSGRTSTLEWSPIGVGRSMAITVGGLFTDQSDVAALVGLGVLAVGVVGVVHLHSRVRSEGVQILIASLVYAVMGLALFGVSRSALGDDAFLASRYMAFAAILVLVVTLLGLMVFERSLSYRVAVAALAIGSVLASETRTVQFDDIAHDSDVSMVAAYMGAGVGVVPLYSEATDAALRSVDHIPFDGSFGDDCGRFGERLEEPSVAADGEVTGAVTRRREPTSSPLLPTASVDVIPVFEVSGWVAADDVECIIVVDPTRRVAGIAVPGRSVASFVPVDGRPSGSRPWTGYVEHDSPVGEVLVKLRGDDRFHVIGELPEE